MCGIAGFVTQEQSVRDRSLLVRMCDRIAHRGPDGAGYYYDGPTALGHRRLSIIDVSGGHQPLGNEDGSVMIVFNGEIYNYLELRRGLEERGHRFKTRSDTEVIVHLYEEVGDRVPEYLNGMFAFAIWDAPAQKLFLARDRMGKKPLYYTTQVPGYRLCFGSELKALTEIEQCPREVDATSLADFLCLSYVPDPKTIYKDIYKLAPAHTLTLGPEGVHIRRYWEARFSPSDVSFEEATGQIRALAGDSVERRMISDVPLGAFLSGGVDSSAAVGFMAEHAPERLKTFSIGFTDERFNELPFARLAAERHRTDHHEEVVTPSVLDTIETLAEHFDEPFGDSSAIPTLYLSKMTRQHVTVALSGDGADEIFAGYRRYSFGVFEDRFRSLLPGWMRRPVFSTLARWYPKFDYLPRPFRAKTLLGNVAQDLPDAYFTSMSTFRDGGLTAVLSNEVRASLGGYSTREMFRGLFAKVRQLPALQQMQWVDLQTWLPGDILVKADRATMAHSLESRSPWLDYRLVELAFRLPWKFNLKGFVTKHIFKQAVAPFLPEKLIQRTKMGFSVPLASWFRTTLKPVFESMVLQEPMQRFLSLPEVRRLWAEHQSGLHNHDRKLWNLLMLAYWAERHLNESKSELTVSYVSETT